MKITQLRKWLIAFFRNIRYKLFLVLKSTKNATIWDLSVKMGFLMGWEYLCSVIERVILGFIQKVFWRDLESQTLKMGINIEEA